MARKRLLLACTALAVALVMFLSHCNLCLLTRGHGAHDMPPITAAAAGATTYDTTFADRTITVYCFGNEGPPVLLLHELPGFSREAIRLAQTIAAHGYRVHAPLLFGRFGETKSGLARLRTACNSGFVHCSSGDATPLAGYVHNVLLKHLRADGDHFVAIGMCLTGNVPPQLLADEKLSPFLAGAVVSQPALPLPLTHSKMRATGLTATQIANAAATKKPILAFRFTGDCISPAERMVELERAFAGQITVFQIDSGACNHAGVPTNAHAVLTQEYRPAEPLHPTNDAVRRLLQFLDHNLKGVPTP